MEVKKLGVVGREVEGRDLRLGFGVDEELLVRLVRLFVVVIAVVVSCPCS